MGINNLHIHKKVYLCSVKIAAVAQLVEHQLPKLRVTGSNPACRSITEIIEKQLNII